MLASAREAGDAGGTEMTESDTEPTGVTLETPDSAAESGAVREAFEPGSAAYAVKLPVFEGPLDLLLHLIRQNDVDIAEIPVAEVSAQYLLYLELMQELNLDIAGEYLVMAATLALIKSRMLLPTEPGEGEDDEVDPRAELVARLLEYQRFKEVAENLSRRRLLGRDVFEAKGPVPERPADSEREIEVGIFELLTAFRTVLRRRRPARRCMMSRPRHLRFGIECSSWWTFSMAASRWTSCEFLMGPGGEHRAAPC